jgi:anti-sigma-K factor RskA
MNMEDHSRYSEELAAYLLGALSAEETREFELHLGDCATCQAEERWLRGAVELLPSSVEQIEPPPELLERLMATVRAEAPARAAVRPEGSRGRRRLFTWRWAPALRPAAALGTLLVLAAGVGGYLLGSEQSGDSGGTSTVAVKGTEVQPAASGTIVRSDDSAVLRVRGLPDPGRDRVYQVWLLRKGSDRPEPSSLFSVHRDGTGAAGIPGLEGAEEVMVSAEPRGGSAQPSSMPVLRTRL